MSFTRDTGEVSAIYRPAADVPALVRPTNSMRYVAPGSLTDGDYGLFRRDMQPRSGGPAAHFHKTFSEAFFVLSGVVRVFDGKAWVEATAGDFLYVPKGGIHGFSHDSDEAASMLILFAPGAARERYFEELAEVADSGRQLSRREWTELYARHDQYMVKGGRGRRAERAKT
jgi:mannose-6-phosphate isomerase-like protein (cupin superfamily)